MELGDENQSVVLFEQEPVRRVMYDGRWFYSVVDICAALAQSTNPTAYWRKLKQRLAAEHSETVTNCHALKMLAPDGKMRDTDCADTENLLRIIQEIPSPKAEPFKQWLAQTGADIIEDRGEDQKRIRNRDQAIEAKKKLHEEVHGRGVHTCKAHAELESRGHDKFYGGESLPASKDRKGIDEEDDIGEWMGSEEIADNLFRDAQSRAYIKRLDITGKEPVNQAHEQVSEKVREFIIDELGGTPPEELPTPKQPLSQVRKDEEGRRLRGMDLFPEIDGE